MRALLGRPLRAKKKDRLAAVSPNFDQLFRSRSFSLPLPTPAEQTESAKAGGEEWESSRNRRGVCAPAAANQIKLDCRRDRPVLSIDKGYVESIAVRHVDRVSDKATGEAGAGTSPIDAVTLMRPGSALPTTGKVRAAILRCVGSGLGKGAGRARQRFREVKCDG